MFSFIRIDFYPLTICAGKVSNFNCLQHTYMDELSNVFLSTNLCFVEFARFLLKMNSFPKITFFFQLVFSFENKIVDAITFII